MVLITGWAYVLPYRPTDWQKSIKNLMRNFLKKVSGYDVLYSITIFFSLYPTSYKVKVGKNLLCL